MGEGIVYLLVAIGSNLAGPGLASPRETCEAALSALRELAQGPLTRSRWFSTAPVPASDQPRFVNGMAGLRVAGDPAAVLARLQAIEQRLGRRRSVPNAARTLDLDIIDLREDMRGEKAGDEKGGGGGLIRAAPDPVLPHPRAHLRRFVLLPLRDLAPRWVHPVLGRSVDDLLAALPPEDIHPL
jgi:2-amino-4-hydroxy-6-hydroxymethyldihydropteridine diphosphokinase